MNNQCTERGPASVKTEEIKEISMIKEIKMAYTNIRSLIRHIDEMCTVVLDGNFDVVIYGESWHHQNV